jgi:hypothetical protein
LPEILQEIGAVAGLASVVGLAVLSALYFSQARDVKRLREWAGRAPERAEQGTPGVPGRVVGQEQPVATPPQVPTPPPVPGRPATPAKPTPAKPTPAGTPATAAAATGAAAATAQQSKPAVAPAGQNANAADDAKPDGGAPKPVTPATPAAADAQPANGKDKPSEDAEEKPAEAETKDEDKQPAAAPAASAGPAPPASAPPVPVVAPAAAATPAAARPAGPPKLPPSPTRFQRPGITSRHSPQETAILPPRKGKRDGMSARYIAIGLVGLLVLGGAAVFGVTQLTGDDGGSGSSQAASDDSGSTDGQPQPKQRKGGAVKPGSVTVAVLNGTTVPGLAATLSDEIGAAGFKVGTITNFSDQQLAESVVQYAPGHDAEGRAVSRKLGITQREPVNPSSQALAGDATVIVIAGADKSP